MAATFPWPSKVVLAKQLTVALGGSLPGNGWLPALKSAIEIFNREMSRNKIALSFVIKSVWKA